MTYKRGGSYSFPEAEYEILIYPDRFESSTSRSSLEGELRSPRLNQQLHPNGRLKLHIGTTGKAKDPNQPTMWLDAFQLRSIERYVHEQSSIRKQLLTRILEVRSTCDVKTLKSKFAVWSEVSLMSLEVRNKILFKHAKGVRPRDLFPDPARGCDKKGTRDRFVMEMTASWANEHALFAYFRDGKLISFELDG